MTTHDATQAAELAARMIGTGWVPETNPEAAGGWRWRVRNGMLAVYPKTTAADGTRYQCLLSQREGDDGGAGFWFDEETYADPNEAVRQQLAVARAFVRRIDQVVSALEATVCGGG